MSEDKRQLNIEIRRLKKELKKARERKENLEKKLKFNLDNAERVLDETYSFNSFLQLKKLSTSIAIENGTIKKRFEATAKIQDVLFDVSYLVDDIKENEITKYYDDIRVKMKEELHEIELRPSLNILQRQKDLKYICDCLKSFAILNSKRIIELNRLQHKYYSFFTFEENRENGGYTVKCVARNTNKNILGAEWRIQWASMKCSLCYTFEFVFEENDEAIVNEISPILKNFCKGCLNVDDSLEKLKCWENLMISIVSIYV